MIVDDHNNIPLIDIDDRVIAGDHIDVSLYYRSINNF